MARSFPQLSYANEGQPRLKRWFIRSVEGLSGREHYARLYDVWRTTIVPSSDQVFTRMLGLVGIDLRVGGAWPVDSVPDGPLVIVANHPFGIGDGIAALSLAERLGRPFRVMINAELLKIPEMAGHSLPIDFSETKEATRNNLAVRQEALDLLKAGVTVVVLPGGGVATAPNGLGAAVDLPWKMFPARLIQEAQATVLPVHFSGQNGRLFHLVSHPMMAAERGKRVNRRLYGLSLTLRTSLLIREFSKLSGRTIHAQVGRPVPWEELRDIGGRRELMSALQQRVMALTPGGNPERPAPRRLFERLVA